MTDRYEAIGCGVYLVDSADEPGEPDERYPKAVTGTDDGLQVDLIDSLPPHGEALAVRIADALNGSEALLAEAVEKFCTAYYAGDALTFVNPDNGELVSATYEVRAFAAALLRGPLANARAEPAGVTG